MTWSAVLSTLMFGTLSGMKILRVSAEVEIKVHLCLFVTCKILLRILLGLDSLKTLTLWLMAGFGYSKTRGASVPVRCLWRWMGIYTHYEQQLTSATIKVKIGIVRKKGLNLFLRYALNDEVDTFLQKIMMWSWQQNFNLTVSKLPICQSYQSKNRYDFKQKNTEWFLLNHWFLDHLLMMNC